MKKLIIITNIFAVSIYINAQEKDTIDPFGFPEDKKHSWVGEKVNIDDHYVMQKDGSYIRKDLYQKQQNQNYTPLFIFGGIILIGTIGYFAGKNNNKKVD